MLVRLVAAAVKASGRDVYGIPPIANQNPDTGNPAPWAADANAVAQANRAKVAVTLPALRTSSYVSFCFAFQTAAGPATETCCPDPAAASCIKVDPPASDIDATNPISWFSITGPTWINSPKGVKPTFGTFPAVRVHTLAFGSLPVSATVQLSQVVGRDGYYTPLDLLYRFSAQFPPGAHVDGWGTVPESPFSVGAGSVLYLTTRLQGPVDVKLSNVVIDGRRVDVGNSCRTAVPARLQLGAPNGWAGAPDTSTPKSAYWGRPGAFTPEPDAQLYGNIEIPRFSGCGSRGDDLDPLLTNFVSSKRNPVTITLTSNLQECDPTDPSCPQVPTQTAPANAAARSAVAVGSPLRTSATESKIAKAIKTLPVRLRASAVNSLPMAVRREVYQRIKH